MSTELNLSPDERNAMRAYLQRVEVRLSTMHRIASAFLGGAGLLILFPVFFNDAIADLMKILFSEAQGVLRSITAVVLAGPLFLSLAIPLYALYLLLRDLVHFYFIGHSPGFPTSLFNPRFVLSGIAFSPDESPAAKRAIQAQEYSSDFINFILPFGEAQASYYDSVIVNTRNQILPSERGIDHLIREGVISRTEDADKILVHSTIPEIRAPQDIDRFNAALGLAGVRDRPLVAEVAKGEASLVRHATGLRRLLLRYMKALLMFILTTLISFTLVALAQASPLFPLALLSIGYLVWSFAAFWVVRRPVHWIYDTADPRSESVVQRDSQLVEFENVVKTLCIAAGIRAAVAGVLTLVILNGES